MQKSSLSLSDLISLQAKNAAHKKNLKSVTGIKLDQLPLMALPQPPGGKRAGAGRKETAEKTAVVRVPVGCLAAVQQLIADYKNPQPEPDSESLYRRNSNLLEYCWGCEEARKRLRSPCGGSIQYKTCRHFAAAQRALGSSTDVVSFASDDSVICSKRKPLAPRHEPD